METQAIKQGWIVIPSKIRRLFELKERNRIPIGMDDKEHAIVLTPITRH